MAARTDIGTFAAIMTDAYIQISDVNGTKRGTLRLVRNYDDDDDQFVISNPAPNRVEAVTKFYKLVLLYHDLPENNMNDQNNGHIELTQKWDENEADFITVVYYQTGVPQDVIERLQDFVLHPENYPWNWGHNNNNNNNNGGNNDPNNNLSTVSEGSMPSLHNVQSLASTASYQSGVVNNHNRRRKRKTRRNLKRRN